MHPLDAISPVDGRYRKQTEPLAKFFSERALMKYRIIVEGEYLIALSQHPCINLREFSEEETGLVRKLYELSLEDAEFIKRTETEKHGIPYINNGKKTNHDVKSIEYYIKHKLRDTSLADCLEYTHFALTSEDTTNIAYALMLSGSLAEVMFPKLNLIKTKLKELILLNRCGSMQQA